VTSPRYPTRTPSVCAENDHPRHGWLSPSSGRSYVPRRAFLLIQGPLLGISDHVSVPSFLPISPTNPLRDISHPAQGLRILSRQAHHDPQIHEAEGYWFHVLEVNALLTPWQNFPRTPPHSPKSYSCHRNPFPGKFQKNLGKWPLRSVAERRFI
jgi:hypothetical protein